MFWMLLKHSKDGARSFTHVRGPLVRIIKEKRNKWLD